MRYGNEVTCLPSTITWKPSKPAVRVRTNSFPSEKGNGQSIPTFLVRPISRFNHQLAFDFSDPSSSSLIHFSHFKNPSTTRSPIVHYLQCKTKLQILDRKSNASNNCTRTAHKMGNYYAPKFQLRVEHPNKAETVRKLHTR